MNLLGSAGRQVLEYTGPDILSANGITINRGDRLVLDQPADLNQTGTIPLTGKNYEHLLTQNPADFTAELPTASLKKADLIDKLLLPLLTP